MVIKRQVNCVFNCKNVAHTSAKYAYIIYKHSYPITDEKIMISSSTHTEYVVQFLTKNDLLLE